MSAGKCKRGPDKPLGVTSSSSDEDSSGNYAVDNASASPKPTLLSSVQSHRRQQRQHQHHQHAALHQPGNLSPAPAAAAQTTGGQSATLPIGSTTAHGLSDVDALSVDYDAVSSPSGSSTLSGSGGSVYERRPGFADHAHSHRLQQPARRPRTKKKKNSVIHGECVLTLTSPRDDDVDIDEDLTFRKATTTNDGNCVEGLFNSPPSARQQECCLTSRQLAVRPPVVARSKTHRDPIPMRMRALPQSMWQEPNVPHNVSPATVYPVLPPLVTREGDDITSLRPVTPNDDREEVNVCDKAAKIPGCTDLSRRHTIHHQHQHHQHTLHLHQQPGEQRVISVAQPELLLKLFDVLENKEHASKAGHRSISSHAKKISGGVKKVLIAPHYRATLFTGQDPYMVNNVADSLFPQLCLERGGYNGGAGPSNGRPSAACGTGTQMVHLQPLPVGDKMIMLPSLIVDQNYPQMLTEIVANM